MAAVGKDVVIMTGAGDMGDGGQVRHIPGAGCYHTLCGWCDCSGAETESIDDVGEPNCNACLDVVRAALKYRRFAK